MEGVKVLTVLDFPMLVESYCENSCCQVRYYHFLLSPCDKPETIYAQKLFCPLCGKQTSLWVGPSVFDEGRQR